MTLPFSDCIKQVALIVIMAHVGSFVPAESATIGSLRKVHRLTFSELLLQQVSLTRFSREFPPKKPSPECKVHFPWIVSKYPLR